MTPDELKDAVDLMAEYERLDHICEGLQRSQYDLRVDSNDVLEAINFDAQAMMRMAQPIWLEVRRHLLRVLEELSKLGVNVSEQRRRFEESSDWRPTPWNQN